MNYDYNYEYDYIFQRKTDYDYDYDYRNVVIDYDCKSAPSHTIPLPI